MRKVFFVLLFLLISTHATEAQSTLLAFPDAQGFGALTTGGRGGQVIYVTTLAPDGEGSLQAALDTEGARTIVFAVSGVIDGIANITHGNLTIAGQTSPGGIIVRGIVCDGHYEANDCDNLIIRHLRSRPAAYLDAPNGANDDALRLDGVENVIIDHVSLAAASDEEMQISMARNVTIQNTIMGETVGEHYQFGGMLLNYSRSEHPQDNISIYHNLWYRISGRLPEITCEPARGLGDDETAEIPSLCGMQALNVEVSDNLLYDAGGPMTYRDNLDETRGMPDAGIFTLNLNLVNNYMVVQPDYTQAMIASVFISQAGNQLFMAENRMNIYPDYRDVDVVYCCNDFNLYNPNSEAPTATILSARHPFPDIAYTPTDELQTYMVANVGAFPRDPLDARYLSHVEGGTFEGTPADLEHEANAPQDVFALSFDAANPPTAPLDSDLDGMPDAWESAHGLDPNAADHNGTVLSPEGYTNLEVYLNELAAQLVGQ
jgi:pectate lyase